MNAIKDMLRDGGRWKYEVDWDGVNMENTFQTFFKKYKNIVEKSKPLIISLIFISKEKNERSSD